MNDILLGAKCGTDGRAFNQSGYSSRTDNIWTSNAFHKEKCLRRRQLLRTATAIPLCGGSQPIARSSEIDGR